MFPFKPRSTRLAAPRLSAKPRMNHCTAGGIATLVALHLGLFESALASRDFNVVLLTRMHVRSRDQERARLRRVAPWRSGGRRHGDRAAFIGTRLWVTGK